MLTMKYTRIEKSAIVNAIMRIKQLIMHTTRRLPKINTSVSLRINVLVISIKKEKSSRMQLSFKTIQRCLVESVLRMLRICKTN